jgi:hypothetical protein
MEHDTNDNNIAINWNTIIGQEARSIDDNADLGKIQLLSWSYILGSASPFIYDCPRYSCIIYLIKILFMSNNDPPNMPASVQGKDT